MSHSFKENPETECWEAVVVCVPPVQVDEVALVDVADQEVVLQEVADHGGDGDAQQQDAPRGAHPAQQLAHGPAGHDVPVAHRGQRDEAPPAALKHGREVVVGRGGVAAVVLAQLQRLGVVDEGGEDERGHEEDGDEGDELLGALPDGHQDDHDARDALHEAEQAEEPEEFHDLQVADVLLDAEAGPYLM